MKTNNSINLIFAFFFLIILPVSLFGQETITEKLLEEQEESSEQSALLEIILNLQEHPLNLNSVNLQKLEAIPGLPPGLALEIIQYRKKHGPFKSKIELLLVQSVNTEIFEYLQALVYIPSVRPKVVKRNKLSWRSRVSNRSSQPEEVENAGYENSSEKIYNRLRFDINNIIQGGLLLEKDSGESRWDDLRLYYLSMEISKNFFMLIGNYQLEIGQGLVLWGPYGFSKSAASVYPTKKRERGIKGYSGVDENASFWGGAGTLTAGPFQFIAFFSRNKLDATPVSENEVSGLVQTGFHRTENEKSKKDLISESVFGGRVRYINPEGLSIGVTGYFSAFNKLLYDTDFTRNRFKFRGKENSVLGIDWAWSKDNFILFGEVARSQNGGLALISGAQIDYGSMQLAFLYRDYQKEFQNLHGFGFGDSNGTTQNETGYYTGLKYKLTTTSNLSVYYDIFKHPWSTYFNPQPTEGQEFLAQIEQKLNKQWQLTFRFRSKHGQETQKFADELTRIKPETIAKHKTQWRLQLEYRVSPRVRLRSRFEYVKYRQKRYAFTGDITKDDGIMMYQEIRLQPKSQLQILGRLSFFETDSYDAAIFQYEHDLPGMVTNQALLGRGNRWYLMVKYKPVKFLQLSVKYSETFHNDLKANDNDPTKIRGKIDRKTGFQIEMKL